MDELLHTKIQDVPAEHINGHEGYEYYRRKLVPPKSGNKCTVSVFEIPPGKSAYPYHYHIKNEEAFYILQGKGVLKTPSGEREISAGDFLFFPANEKGAHKLTNNSDDEMLIYLDFDTQNEIDIAFYPDSEKVGIWGRDIDCLFRLEQKTGYYDRE